MTLSTALDRRADPLQFPRKLPARVTCGWPQGVAPRRAATDGRAASVARVTAPDDTGESFKLTRKQNFILIGAKYPAPSD